MSDGIPQRFIIITEDNRDRITRILKRLIANKRSDFLVKMSEQVHPKDFARLWQSFSDSEKSFILHILSDEYSAQLLSELEIDERKKVFKSKDIDWLADRLEELEPDDIVDILKEMDNWEANQITKRFRPGYSEKIKKLMQYPEETAGALMNSDFIAVKPNAKIDNIINQFRKAVEVGEFENIHFIYVIDKFQKLIGYVPIRLLILEKSSKTAKEIMKPPPVTVLDTMDQEQVAKIFKDFDLISIPVVNEAGRILGRITIDDIVDVMEQEASEDAFKMVGLTKEDVGYTSIFTSFRLRIPWMFVNLLTTSLSALVISHYSNIINKYVILAVFMPMIAALGGATGNQMVTIIVRGLALGEMHWHQVKRTLLREITAVSIGAVIIGCIIGGVAWSLQQNYLLGIVTSSALILNMILATLIGGGIPLILKFVKLDPALGSSILVAASTDLFGFFIFLGLAATLL